MATEILTKEDLKQFKEELILDIKLLLKKDAKPAIQWLKTKQVLKLLSISSNTLQNLRVTGKLKFNKVGGIYYYNLEDIQTVLSGKGRL
jgi:hypothetical protein